MQEARREIKTRSQRKIAEAGFRRWVSYLLAAAAIGCILALLLVSHRPISITLQPDGIGLEEPGSTAFVYHLGRAVAMGDDNAVRSRSDLVLLENGHPLRAAHALHDDIRKIGLGRYSHWGMNLIFTALDNTDPRTNGRCYEVVASPRARGFYYGCFGALAASLAGLAALSPRLFAKVYFLGPPTLALCGGVVFLAAALYGWLRGIAPAITTIFEILPCERQLVRIEPMMPAILLSWAAGGAAIGWIAWWGRRRAFSAPLRQEELRLSRLLRRWGLCLTVFLFVFALAVRWSSVPRPLTTSDPTPYAALFGHVPWSDAHGYYWGGCHAVATGKINEWNERRPVNAALFGLRLAACGCDLDIATLLQVLLAAVAVYFAAWSLGEQLGVWSGIGCAALLLGYARMFLATTLSETLGISLGAISLALLFRAQRRRDWRLCTAGLLTLALALSARAGAMFILPCLLVWVVWHFVPPWRRCFKAAFAGSLVVALGMGSSFALDRMYGVGGSTAGANLAHTMCGLSCGTSWSAACEIYAEELAKMPIEKEQARFLYEKAWQRIQANPSIFLHALWEGEKAYFDQLPGFVRQTTCFELISGTRLATTVQSCVLLGLMLGAVVYFWRSRTTGDFWFWLAVACGVMLSVPFIFLDGGWRVLAASWPLMIGPLAAGLASPRRRSPWPSSATRWNCRAAIGLLLALVLLIAAGPALASLASGRAPAGEKLAMADHRRLIIPSWPAFAAVAVVAEGQPRVQGVPTITLQQFRDGIRLSNMEDRDSLLAPDAPPVPFLILSTYDTIAGTTVHLLAPLELKDQTSPFIDVHARRWRKSAYFWEVLQFKPAE